MTTDQLPCPADRERLNQKLEFDVKAKAEHAFGTINMDKRIVLNPVIKDGQVVALSGTAQPPDGGDIVTGELTVHEDGTVASDQADFMPAVNFLSVSKSTLDRLATSDEAVKIAGKFEIRGSLRDVNTTLTRDSAIGEVPVRLKVSIADPKGRIDLTAINTYDDRGIPTRARMSGTVVEMMMTVQVTMSMSRL